MTKSLVAKARRELILNRIPFPSRWNSQGGLYGTQAQDRFTQLNASGVQGTMYGIIQLLSTGAQAYGEWNLYRKRRDKRVRYASSDRGSDTRTEVLQHQALRLWKRPNHFMTGQEFREIGWQHMELAGEWYWVLDRGPSGTGIPIEMWPVRPDRMEPVPDKDKFLAGWLYTGPNGEPVPLSTDEVIQLRYPHPIDYYRGLSAVQAILIDIDAARYSAEWSRNFFLNSAQPGGIVTFAKRLSDDEFTEFTDRWREQHQGVSRGHRVGVLEQGASWTPNTFSLREMEFPELRRVTTDMLRQAYRIHQSMMGESTDVNRANATVAQEVHISWHEIPRLDRTKIVLNTKFLEIFGDEEAVEFDYPDPNPRNREQDNAELTAKTNAVATLIKAGFDPHAVLECVGLPDMDLAEPVPAPALPPGGILPPGQPPVAAPALAPSSPAPPATPALDRYWQDRDREISGDLAQIIREGFSEAARGNGNGRGLR